jgi:SOS-response transcriptional repressor LexA
MLPYFREGDVLIVGERLRRVREGDIVVAGFHSGEHTVKRVHIVDEATWELQPVNPAYPVQRVKPEEDLAWYAPVLVRVEPIYRRRSVPWEKDQA